MRSLNEAAQFVSDSIKALGLDIRPSSRMYEMIESLRNEDGTWKSFIGVNENDFNIVREGLRDLTLLEFFFDQVDLIKEQKHIRDKVKNVLKDSVLPQKDIKGSPGRDIQAELFVFAMCKKAGLYPKFKEPDIVCSLICRSLGIAVKRIKNLDQFVKRVKEGASQINRKSLTGIVIVEVTNAINPENIEITESVSGRRDVLKQLIDREYNNLSKAVEGKGVMAVILHDHQIRIVDSSGGRKLETITYSVSMCGSDRKLQKQLDRFIKKYSSAPPNPIVL